jgi:hypothetical protein
MLGFCEPMYLKPIFEASTEVGRFPVSHNLEENNNVKNTK